jgi:hypothetical protein
MQAKKEKIMNLRDWIKKYGKQKKYFYKPLGICANTFNRILEGHDFSLKTAVQLSDLTDGEVQLDDLIDGIEHPRAIKESDISAKKPKSKKKYQL